MNKVALIWMAVITMLLAAEAGFLYYKNTQLEQQIKIIQSSQFIPPTCRPRPPCLDATPRCLIPETSDMCPPSAKPTNSTTYTCPPNGWVDCMPGIGAAVKKECTSEAMAWYKTNCPNFQGGAL